MSIKASVSRKLVLKSAIIGAFTKLLPQHQYHNPVMFTVYVACILTSVLACQELLTNGASTFTGLIAAWLWFTLLFANFSEALAEHRGQAQAFALRNARQQIRAKKLANASRNAPFFLIDANKLVCGDFVLVESGDIIPGDGEVVEGAACIDESAITGESAPVIREYGGDRNTVTGGTLVISDWLIIQISVNPGETFLDHMIALVEGSHRQKTPNELALTILLAALSIIFIVVCLTLHVFSTSTGANTLSLTVLIALYVCLAPTTISGLLSAIGIAGMNRMLKANVIAMSGHAIEAAGDVDILLLDKTGTITLGNRQATRFLSAQDVSINDLVEAAFLASTADETPEGRSIVVLAKEKYGLNPTDNTIAHATFIPFTAETRMSGANIAQREIRKGSLLSIKHYVETKGEIFPASITTIANQIAGEGATPLVVTDNHRVLGVIELQDIIKPNIHKRFNQLKRMGIKTIMLTGDNPLTAASIAKQAGVDDFHANATPNDKLVLIRTLQQQGHIVAMAGDGTNDSPALAQADVAVAMNSGTQAAKEAGNFIDLDSNPTKLIEIIAIGKQLLMTRGALTTFSFSNDVAKYFAILPAAFASLYPELNALNIMQLHTSKTAILSAVIFNALIIIALVPLALRGVKYKAMSAAKLLQRHALLYGVGGFIAPFAGIKFIDLGLSYLC